MMRYWDSTTKEWKRQAKIADAATLALIKAKADNLDILLSTRASEATLNAIKAALGSVGTDYLRVQTV